MIRWGRNGGQAKRSKKAIASEKSLFFGGGGWGGLCVVLFVWGWVFGFGGGVWWGTGPRKENLPTNRKKVNQHAEKKKWQRK